MSITCGTMRKFDEKDADKNKSDRPIFKGNISLADVLNGDLTLTKNPYHKPNTERPLYDVAVRLDGRTQNLKLGAAWLKNNPETGDYLSITLDNPRWPNPLNLAAFPPEGKDVDWRIVWSRPRGARVQSRAEEMADDEIPY